MSRVVKLVVTQATLEQRAFWRNPQAAFFTFAMPIVLLLMFGFLNGQDAVPGRPEMDPLTMIVPGFLAFGLIAAAYGNLATTVTALRCDGVLKRVQTTPLSPAVYLAGLLASTVIVSVAVTATTVLLGATLFDVAPTGRGTLVFIAVLILGVACFAALGLAVSGRIANADAAAPVTTGTYVPLAILSGTFAYDLDLPQWLTRIVAALPIKAITDGLRMAYDPTTTQLPVTQLLTLGLWTTAGLLLAHRWFRWEP